MNGARIVTRRGHVTEHPAAHRSWVQILGKDPCQSLALPGPTVIKSAKRWGRSTLNSLRAGYAPNGEAD